jgi:glutathione synthase/RimK-type ligase-like ATP-grasp enzyme
MKKILILTDQDDAHGRVVTTALRKKGVWANRWNPREFLLKHKINLFFQPGAGFDIVSEEININLKEIDIVWFRRPGLPTMPESIHPADITFMKEESMVFMRSLWSFMCESATWINPYSSYYVANSKLSQLSIALKLGLTIPNTLISNDRNEIVEFINQNKATGAIYKAFMPSTWEEGGEMFSSQTAAISADILPSQTTLQITPGIYQSQVSKAYEVRATFFNDHCITVRIDNQNEVDWRSLFFKGHVPVSEIKLPSFIQDKCLELMKQLGIIFGCFDFIVTPSGEYVFLEVNEMGQFLWIEESLPQLKLLDTFCDFIISTANKVSHSNYAPAVNLADIEDDKLYKEILASDLLASHA